MHDHDLWGQIEGSRELREWFGSIPTFHDAYLLSSGVATDGSGHLKLHTWRMTDRVDARGYFELERHVVVTFRLTGVTDLQLGGLATVSILGGLTIKRSDGGGYEIELESIADDYGWVLAQDIRIEFEPGDPRAEG